MFLNTQAVERREGLGVDEHKGHGAQAWDQGQQVEDGKDGEHGKDETVFTMVELESGIINVTFNQRGEEPSGFGEKEEEDGEVDGEEGDYEVMDVGNRSQHIITHEPAPPALPSLDDAADEGDDFMDSFTAPSTATPPETKPTADVYLLLDHGHHGDFFHPSTPLASTSTSATTSIEVLQPLLAMSTALTPPMSDVTSGLSDDKVDCYTFDLDSPSSTSGDKTSDPILTTSIITTSLASRSGQDLVSPLEAPATTLSEEPDTCPPHDIPPHDTSLTTTDMSSIKTLPPTSDTTTTAVALSALVVQQGPWQGEEGQDTDDKVCIDSCGASPITAIEVTGGNQAAISSSSTILRDTTRDAAVGAREVVVVEEQEGQQWGEEQQETDDLSGHEQGYEYDRLLHSVTAAIWVLVVACLFVFASNWLVRHPTIYMRTWCSRGGDPSINRHLLISCVCDMYIRIEYVGVFLPSLKSMPTHTNQTLIFDSDPAVDLLLAVSRIVRRSPRPTRAHPARHHHQPPTWLLPPPTALRSVLVKWCLDGPISR
jgi:hypothetical protein